MLRTLIFFAFVATFALGSERRNDKFVGRVIGGHDATPGQFPWAGYIITNVGLCSANLLKKRWAITAGRCVVGVTSGDVYFGHPKKGHADEKHNTFKYSVKHPSFDGAGSFDLALVKLDKDYEFTINLYPIVLPDKEDQFFENVQGYISGFGYLAGNVLPDTMQYSQMLVWSRDECKRHYPEQGDFFTCAYSSSSITCSGDTGGAFVVYDNGAMRLIGISSKVFVLNGVCQSESGGGFVRMGAHKKWIEETAVDDPADSCPVCPVCPIKPVIDFEL